MKIVALISIIVLAGCAHHIDLRVSMMESQIAEIRAAEAKERAQTIELVASAMDEWGKSLEARLHALEVKVDFLLKAGIKDDQEKIAELKTKFEAFKSRKELQAIDPNDKEFWDEFNRVKAQMDSIGSKNPLPE